MKCFTGEKKKKIFTVSFSLLEKKNKLLKERSLLSLTGFVTISPHCSKNVPAVDFVSSGH